MDDKMMIPYVAHEGIVDRMERTIKKLWILVIIFIVAFLLSNVAWLYVFQLYDYSSESTTTETTYTQDGQGVNVIGNDNEVKDGAKDDKTNVSEKGDAQP